MEQHHDTSYIELGGSYTEKGASASSSVAATTTAAASLPASKEADGMNDNNNDDDDDDDDHDDMFFFLSPTRGFVRQMRAFRNMAWPYFHEQADARRLLCGILVLTVLNSAVSVIFSYLARDFWTALSSNQPEAFYRVMQQFLVTLLILAPVHVMYRYQRQRLAIHWRGWMTERVLQLYASHSSVYYGLERSVHVRQQPYLQQQQQHFNLRTSKQPANATSVDNPDQRIAEDVRSFTEFSLSLFLTILTSLMDLVCFSIVLFTILPQLFLAILAFAGVGTVMTVLIGRVLIQLNYDKLQKEADFRFALVRLREHAEQVAFLAGEDVEKRQIQYRLMQVIGNMHSINSALRNLDFFTTYYTYLTWILPILVIAPAYFAGQVEIGVVQQAAASFSHVLSDLSLLITQWDSLSEFSAGIDRLYTFLRAMQILDPSRITTRNFMDHAQKNDPSALATANLLQLPDYSTQAAPLVRPPPLPSQPPPPTRRTPLWLQQHLSFEMSHAMMVRDLTLTIPTSYHYHHHYQHYAKHGDERILVQNLHFDLPWGKRLLITGASGTGKSSLLRAMAGLWTWGSGTIHRPVDNEVYFLPQKPYCCIGSLRDQLLYPQISFSWSDDSTDHAEDEYEYRSSSEITVSDQALLEILRAVDLADLPQRAAAAASSSSSSSSSGVLCRDDTNELLDTVLDWSNVLSLGEQQRLAFGRVLIHQPRFIVLDESTSALDVESERRMYQLLLQQIRPRPNAHASNTAAQPFGADSSLSHPGVTLVSVGHRPTLLEYHDLRLELYKDGSYRMEPIPISHP